MDSRGGVDEPVVTGSALQRSRESVGGCRSSDVPVRRPSSPLYVLWDAELQEAFNRLAEREGVRRAAQMLDVAERNLYDYRAGLARAGNRKGTVHERKFIGLPVLERLADALDELELEDREALTQREWVDRGEWAWSTNPREGNRFVSREGAA